MREKNGVTFVISLSHSLRSLIPISWNLLDVSVGEDSQRDRLWVRDDD